MTRYLLVWRVLSLLGFIGLIATIILWNTVLTPVQQMHSALEIFILIAPLVFFARGMIQGDRDKHVAVTLLSFVYFCLGIWFIFAPEEQSYGYALTFFSVCLYLGGFLYARSKDKLELQAVSSIDNDG